VKVVKARPNVCGYNAFHTAGGFMLRPSSNLPDSKLPPEDIFIFKKFGEHSIPLTSYPVHSVYEDLTWDKSRVMGGAGDDWAYDHLGVYSWTTEFWDAIYHATGEHSPTDVWYVGQLLHKIWQCVAGATNTHQTRTWRGIPTTIHNSDPSSLVESTLYIYGPMRHHLD
jgi:hypothetical protein